MHEFDAWAAAFGETATELELQPSGTYKPVTRFAAFINVADLMMMFRSGGSPHAWCRRPTCAAIYDAAAHPRRPAPAGHRRGKPGLQGPSAPPRGPDRGDRIPHRPGAEGWRHPVGGVKATRPQNVNSFH